VESYPYPAWEGQRYINLNLGHLFIQQPPKKGKGSRGSPGYVILNYLSCSIENVAGDNATVKIQTIASATVLSSALISLRNRSQKMFVVGTATSNLSTFSSRCSILSTCKQDHSHFVVKIIFGPIPWGHSGPLCHALSFWTSMRRWRATVQRRHLVNWREAARGEWAQHFSNASYLKTHSDVKR